MGRTLGHRRGDPSRPAHRDDEGRPCTAHGGVVLTASIGVASFPGQEIVTVNDLFARADEALYRAKALGRNKVCT